MIMVHARVIVVSLEAYIQTAVEAAFVGASSMQQKSVSTSLKVFGSAPSGPSNHSSDNLAFYGAIREAGGCKG